MGSLSSLYISQSYQSLTHLGTNNALSTGTMTQLQDGIGQSLNISFDGTNISSSGNIYGANITASVINTGSFVSTSSFNSYTSSTNARLSSIETTTASLIVSSSNSLYTASFNNGTRNLTFTKGDNQTFSVNIPDVSGSTFDTGSFATTGSNTFDGSQYISGGVEISGFFGDLKLTSEFLGSKQGSTTFSQNYNSQTLRISQADGALGVEFQTDVNISGSLSASLNNGYVWVGNGSNRNVLVPTSSFIDTFNSSSLVTTSSFNAYTSSTNTSITNLNASSASQQISINAINSVSGSWITESETASFARTNIDNNFTANQTFTNITAVSASFQYLQTLYETASVIYSSGSNQFGDELTDIQTLSGSVKVQGSLTINGTPVQTSSVDISALNSFTASQLTINTAIQASTSSLNTATASLFTSASLALVTASVSLNTITFTKGDTSTFNIIINTGSATTTDITALNSFTASQETKDTTLASVTSSLNTATASLFTSASLALVTASFDNGTRNLTFTKGNTTQFSVNIPDASGSTGNFATTGSNTFVGNQTITGSLFISGNINMVNGADIVTHHVRAQGSNGLELQTSAGTIIVAMGQGGGTQASFVGAVTANSISASTINGLGDPLAFSTSVDSRLDSLEGVSGSFTTTASFNSYTSSTNSRLTNIESTTASLNSSVTQLNTATASLFTSTSLSLTTASFAGNTLTFTKGNGTTFGVVIPDVSGSTINTGSLMVTGSVNVNVLTFTKGDGTTFDLTVAASGSAPAGTVSSSAQILNYNIFATTGSNTFNGDQNISGAINFENGTYLIGPSGQQTELNSPNRSILIRSGVNMTLSGSSNLNLNSPNITLSGSAITINGNQTINGAGTSAVVLQVNKTIGNYNPDIQVGNWGGGQGFSLSQFDDGTAFTSAGMFMAGISGAFQDMYVNQGNYDSFRFELGSASPGGLNSGVWFMDFDGAQYSPFMNVGTNAGDITLYRDTNITGSLNMSGSVNFATGSNKQAGTATLNGGNPGVVTVSNSLVSANSIILLTKQTLTNAHMVAVSAKSGGSFTITSNGNGDADTVGWFIINNS